MACLKRLYEGIAGSPVVPFSFSAANTGMNNQEGRSLRERDRAVVPALFPSTVLSLFILTNEMMTKPPLLLLMLSVFLCIFLLSVTFSCAHCRATSLAGTGAVMLRTGPAALSRPGPFGAAGFHPSVATSTPARSDRSGHAAFTMPAIKLPALR